MEIGINFSRITGNNDKISKWNQKTLQAIKPNFEKFSYLSAAIDKLGDASAKAQKLPQVITTTAKTMYSDHNCYVYADGTKVIGLIKVGKKKLFYRTETSAFKEIEPMCVLDFYVHESVQRIGIGKVLFEHMLKEEQIQPHKLAYDRPSPKLIGFLAKHYQLRDYVPQTNNFVVFKKYFAGVPVVNTGSMASISMRPLTARGKEKKTDNQTENQVDQNTDPKPSVQPPQKVYNPISNSYNDTRETGKYNRRKLESPLSPNIQPNVPPQPLRSTRPY